MQWDARVRLTRSRPATPTSYDARAVSQDARGPGGGGVTQDILADQRDARRYESLR